MIQPKVQGPVKPPKLKSKLEILNDIKKMIEKNNFSISDDVILSLYEQMGEKAIETFNQMCKVENEKKNVFTLDFNVSEVQLNKVHTIKIFPVKRIYVEKYDQWIDLNDKLFDKLISNSKSPALFQPFGDAEHERGKNHFDILRLHKNFNREPGLFADVRFTPRGYEAVKNRDYKYISPDWGDRTDTDKNLHVDTLTAIALTNTPAMEGDVKTIQEQIQLSKSIQGGLKMPKLIKTWTLEKKLDFMQGQLQGDAPTIDPAVIGEALSLIQEVAMKLEESLGANEALKEENQELAKVNKEVIGELAETKSAVLTKECNEFLDKAVEKGQIPSSETLRERYIKRYLLNKEDVIAEIGEFKESNNFQLTSSRKGDSIQLSKDDIEIMKNSKLDPNKKEDVQRYLDINPDLQELNKGGAE